LYESIAYLPNHPASVVACAHDWGCRPWGRQAGLGVAKAVGRGGAEGAARRRPTAQDAEAGPFHGVSVSAAHATVASNIEALAVIGAICSRWRAGPGVARITCRCDGGTRNIMRPRTQAESATARSRRTRGGDAERESMAIRTPGISNLIRRTFTPRRSAPLVQRRGHDVAVRPADKPPPGRIQPPLPASRSPCSTVGGGGGDYRRASPSPARPTTAHWRPQNGQPPAASAGPRVPPTRIIPVPYLPPGRPAKQKDLHQCPTNVTLAEDMTPVMLILPRCPSARPTPPERYRTPARPAGNNLLRVRPGPLARPPPSRFERGHPPSQQAHQRCSPASPQLFGPTSALQRSRPGPRPRPPPRAIPGSAPRPPGSPTRLPPRSPTVPSGRSRLRPHSQRYRCPPSATAPPKLRPPTDKRYTRSSG